MSDRPGMPGTNNDDRGQPSSEHHLAARSLSVWKGWLVEPRPTGTVTFLFTDIEGSTRLWETDPDAMDAALELHDELLREAVAAHGGYVFSTGGDSFAAAFSVVGDAVAAASDA